MWNRKELKAKGKTAFRSNYGYAVLWALVIMLLTTPITTFTANINEGSVSYGALNGIGGLWAIAVIIVGGPLRVGYSRWRLHCAGEGGPAAAADMGYYFQGGRMGRTLLGIFLTGLITVLWSLLLIVPGIVAAYHYRLVPFLMAENEEMTGKEARAKSKEMMKGHKWNAFVLDLSFIGWGLLSGLTCGILNLLWVAPYKNATDCELYRAIRGEKPAAEGPAAAYGYTGNPAAAPVQPGSAYVGYQPVVSGSAAAAEPAAQPAYIFCPTCGKKQRATDKYCQECGAPLQ